MLDLVGGFGGVLVGIMASREAEEEQRPVARVLEVVSECREDGEQVLLRQWFRPTLGCTMSMPDSPERRLDQFGSHWVRSVHNGIVGGGCCQPIPLSEFIKTPRKQTNRYTTTN